MNSTILDVLFEISAIDRIHVSNAELSFFVLCVPVLLNVVVWF